jgi:primase-polymerase (primpol)-like protein
MHRLAFPTDAATWGTLEEALIALQSGAYNGIGFAFSEQDPFVGIDLDHCVHDNRRIDYRQAQLIRRMKSYSEYSPRDGVHMIVKARLPITTLKRGNLELFNSGHMMALTVRHIAGTPLTIEDRQAELDALYQRLISSPSEEVTSPVVVWQGETRGLTEVEKRLIVQWKTEWQTFKCYYEGDSSLWQGDTKAVASKSEADCVLCLILLTKTHDNVEQTTPLFRASGLYDRQKTDRQTGHDPVTGRPVSYLEMTIFNALRKRRKPR